MNFKTDYRLMQVKSIAFCNTFDLHSAIDVSQPLSNDLWIILFQKVNAYHVK